MNPASWSGLTAGCSLQTTGSDGPDRISRTLYTLAGELYQQQAAYNTPLATIVSTSSYTSNGQLATITDANGNVTTYTHDGHGRLFRTCYPGSTSCTGSNPGDYEQLSYEDTGAGSSLRTSGLIASRRLRDGRSIGYTHDALGRLTFKDVPAGGYWDGDITYAYDLLGRRLSASSSQGGTGTDSLWSWDALGRMTAEDSGFGFNGLDYDLAGRLVRFNFTGGGDLVHVDYEYLVTGEMISVRENGVSSSVTSCGGQAACVLARFGYDDLGRRTALQRGDGTSTAYQYNPATLLSQLAESIPGTDYSQTLGFGYNRAGQITGRESTNHRYTYAGQVNASVTETVNGLNQLTGRVTSAGTTALAYDANGNVEEIGSAAYSYTSENRLATAPNGIYLPYWPSGNLWEVYESPTVQTMFEHVAGSIVSERDATGAITHRYVRGPGVDEVLVEYLGTGTSARRFLHADERGSIVAITNDTGGMIAVNSYDEYGIPAAGNTGRFQYTGQPWIAQVAMYYYRARFYNPRLGRFMQTDPIGYGGGMNLYGYVAGDPVNLSDPSGLYAYQPPGFGTLIGGRECRTCTGWTDAGPMADAGPGQNSGNMSGGSNAGGSNGSGPSTSGWTKHQAYQVGDCPGGQCFLGSPWLTYSLPMFDNISFTLGRDTHEFFSGPFLICRTSSAGCNADTIRSVFPSFIVPGLGAPVRSGAISPVYTGHGSLIAGYVQTLISADGLFASNITQPGHWFYNGRVDIANIERGGAWWVGAHGHGNNLNWLNARANEFFGQGAFDGMLGSYISVVRSRLRQ